MTFKHQKILVLAPHTDDGEFGVGGSIAKFIEEGKEVWYAAFSSCEESVPKGFPKDALKTEVKKATKSLGILPNHLILFEHPVRHFPEHRQSILEELVSLRNSLKPDLVFVPSVYDIHQDHQVIVQEGIRAYKQSSSILGYEAPWNSVSLHLQTAAPRASYFEQLDEAHVQKKVKAIQQYKSQGRRVYADKEYLVSLARVRGAQIAVKFAEAFEVIRLISRSRA